jgi:hypothetical protein
MRKSVAPEQIARAILVLRGHRVLLDAELAALYGATTKRLNEQNPGRDSSSKPVAKCDRFPEASRSALCDQNVNASVSATGSRR